jgi:hypothetical protein
VEARFGREPVQQLLELVTIVVGGGIGVEVARDVGFGVFQRLVDVRRHDQLQGASDEPPRSPGALQRLQNSHPESIKGLAESETRAVGQSHDKAADRLDPEGETQLPEGYPRQPVPWKEGVGIEIYRKASAVGNGA